MSNWDDLIVRGALDFTAKFGFLTRDIFFSDLCAKSRARKYSNWQHLLTTGYFYESRSDRNVFHLSKKGFALAGPNPVRRRPSIFIPHDSHVGRMWFSLKQIALTSASWTEGQLKQTPWDAMGVLGSENLEKIPDLVFDLRSSEKTLRLAVEVEATRKSKIRYDEMALTYMRMKAIQLIVFVCEDVALEMQVRKAFDSEFYREGHKVVVTMLLKDLRDLALEAQVRIGNRQMRFEDVLSRALKLERLPRWSTRDERETLVSQLDTPERTAA